MSDNDYLVLKGLVAKYSFGGVLEELIRIARAGARTAMPKWERIRKALKQAQVFYVSKVEYDDELDAEEARSNIQPQFRTSARPQMQQAVRGVPVLRSHTGAGQAASPARR